MTALIALSYSRLSDYETCPLKFKQKYIDKSYPDDSNNPAFVKGNAIHKQVEDFINFLNSDDQDEPSMGQHTKTVVPMLKKLHNASNGQMFPEKQIAVNQEWEKCGWFDPPKVVKYRAIIDFMVFLNPAVLILGDIKSGKLREYEDSPTSQLRLTAAMCFNLFPTVQKITTAYFFVEHDKTVKVKFTRDQLADLMAPFDEAHTQVNQEEEWPFKKNKYCHWCLSTDCPVKDK